jgi:hypothetical protein
MVQVEVTALHTASSITTTLTAFALMADQVAAMSITNLTVTPLTLGSAPWSNASSDFEFSMDGWYASPLVRVDCVGSIGRALGGPGMISTDRSLRKTYAPPLVSASCYNLLTILFTGTGSLASLPTRPCWCSSRCTSSARGATSVSRCLPMVSWSGRKIL